MSTPVDDPPPGGLAGPPPSTWEFDVLAAAEGGGCGLREVAWEIFESTGVTARFGVPDERFQAFLGRMELLYSVENPYHCALHAADVLAATHCLRMGFPDVFDDVEILALYIGALGHDAGHFRFNNAFLKNSKHTLFRKYPDSVLENFHLGLVFELVDDPEVGIATHLDETQLTRFKELVTNLILATDMSKHRLLVDRFKDWCQRSKEEHAQRRRDAMLHDTLGSDNSNGTNTPMDTTASDELHGHKRWAGWVEPAVASSSPEDKTLVMQLLLKCADLGNVVRPLEMADAWGKRIMEEFYQQGEKELALGLPLTTFPNRKNFDYIFARHQNGFLVNVVKPLFETFTQLTDDETRESVLSSAAENGDAWSQRENANRPGANKLARKRSDKGTPMGSLVQRSRSSFSNARSSSTRFRGSSQHWLRSFKESNLTMLTSNAMEMKGLEITLEENYGAGDEVRAATRLCLPFIPRLELIRLAELGLLGMSDGTIGSSKRLPFLKAQGGRHLPLQDATAHAAAHLSAGVEFDAATVVVSFGGFLELMHRALDSDDADTTDDDRAQIVSGALSTLLAQAVRAVHANGGDVVRMGYDGMACVFPMSGPSAKNRAAGAVLRACKCAFQLVSQLSFSTPELSAVNHEDRVEGQLTPAQAWPGLRRYSQGLRVLVVETLQLSRMTLGRLLDHFGVMAHFAENASQAAAACANMEFDVMFIGIMLPEVDGYDVCRHVRKYGGPVNGKAYIAALTSVDAPELLSQCQAAGMNEVMRKPTSMQLLHGVFKRAKRHAREEKKKAKMSRGRLKLGGLSADEVAAQERPRPRRINSYAPSDPFAKKEKTDAEKEKEEREKCVPVNLPRYTDMLLASSAARIRQSAHSRASTSSGSNDDGFKRASWIARLAGSLCGGGSGMNNSEITSTTHSGLPGVDTDSAEAMGVAGSYVRPNIDVRTEATIGLVKYKAPSAVSAVSSTEGAVAAYEAKETDELFEDTSDDSSSDEDPDEMPVCITVTATVGFGKVGVVRVGGSAAYAVKTSRDLLVRAQRERGQHNTASPIREERRVSGGYAHNGRGGPIAGGSPGGGHHGGMTWDDATDLLLHASRDEVFAIDAPAAGHRGCPAAARAAAGGPGVGGPFQQCATLNLLATTGDATMSPVAWRMVRGNVMVDAPPRLRGGVRLNRLHVHEVVPPLTDHVLAQANLYAIIPRAPDPVLALMSMAGLLPRPLRAAVLEIAPATSQALEQQAKIIEERVGGNDSGSDAGASGSGRPSQGTAAAGSTNQSTGSGHGRLVVEMPKLKARIMEAVEVVLYVPGPSSGVKGHCVSGDTTDINANIYTTSTSAVMDLILRFPGAVLSRVTSDVLFRRDVDALTGGSGGGGDGVIYYCTFPIHALGQGKDSSALVFDTLGSESSSIAGRANRALAFERLRETNHQAPAMAVAFALAARAAMAHCGHSSVSLGVAMGKTVAMPAGEQSDRCEWSVVGDAVSRAERLAEFADSEVLCDLRVQRACVGQRVDFDPVPHASGDDTARARNLAPGVLDSILAKASGSGANKTPDRDGGDGVFGGMTSGMGVLELSERGKESGDGLAPGPTVLMPADLVEMYGKNDGGREERTRGKNDGATIIEEEDEEGGTSKTKKKDSDTDSKKSSKDELLSTEKAAKPSPSAAAALSAAAAACAAADSLYRAERPTRSMRAKRPPNLPAISRETTLMAAKRVVAEAQEAMAPRLLFLEGPPHSGKTKAASAVLDTPEVRRLWLLRVRGCQPVGSANVAGAQPLKPFVSVFRQLLGFAEETSWRSRKNAMVALLESCGDTLDRYGRYAKPILELLELEEPEGYTADGKVRGSGSGTGSNNGDGSVGKWQLGTDSGSDGLSGSSGSRSFGLALGERTPSFSGGSKDTSRSNSKKGSGLNLHSLQQPAKASSSRGSAGRGFAHRETSMGSGSMGSGGRTNTTHNAEVNILDAMSSAAVNDAYEYLSPVATAALLADGFGESYIPLQPHVFDETDSESSDGEGGTLDGARHERQTPRAGGDAGVAISNARKRMSIDIPSGNHSPAKRASSNSSAGRLSEIKSTGTLSMESPDRSDADDAFDSEPTIGGRTYPVIAGRLSASVAFTRQRNGVQRRDHNERFTASVDRRKLSLASLLLSEEGVKRACKALALMLQRLLLGRSTQAAPAQPSIPGFLLFVEDSHMLDPLSMGLVRAILEECSIPLVVMMTHLERGSKPAGGRKLVSSTSRKGGTKTFDRLESIPSGRGLSSLTEAASDANSQFSKIDEKQKDAPAPVVNPQSGGSKHDSSWTTLEQMMTIDYTSKIWDTQSRRQLESMLGQTYATTVDLAPMSQSDLRVLVENVCASRLLPKDKTNGNRRTSTGSEVDTAHGGNLSDGNHASDSDGSSRASSVKSGASMTNQSEICGLPASLHQAIYGQTGGNALFASMTCELLCDSGAVSVTQNTHGVREVKVRTDETKPSLTPSAGKITSMSLAEIASENVKTSLTKDAAVAIGVLSALGECFGSVHACECIQRALARVEREEDPSSPMDREEQRLRSESHARAATALVDIFVGESSRISVDGKPRIQFAPPEKESDALTVEAGLDSVEYVSRASSAVAELVARGYLAPDWASTDDAFGSAEVYAQLAHVEFAGDGLDFPLCKPKTVSDVYHGRPRGGEGSRGRIGRIAQIRFVNDAVRKNVYLSTPPRHRRAAHIDAVLSLRESASRAEDWLNDPASTASLYEAVARHLATLSSADVAALESDERNRAADVQRQLGNVELRPMASGGGARRHSSSTVEATDSDASLGIPSTGTLVSQSSSRSGTFNERGWSADVHPHEAISAAGAFGLRVRCHENAALAHLRRGTQLLALASVASAGVAASAWTDACIPLNKFYQRCVTSASGVDAKNLKAIRAALLDDADRKVLQVRSASWAILANRLTLGLGDGHPPLLFCGLHSAADDGNFAPLRNLRRGMQILGMKWPLDDQRLRNANAGADRNALNLVHSMFPAAFGRESGSGACGLNGCVDGNSFAIIRKLSGRFKQVEPAVARSIAKLGMDFFSTDGDDNVTRENIASSSQAPSSGLDTSVMAGHNAWAMEVDEFRAMNSMAPGIGDVVAFGKQLSKDKNVSKATRDIAKKSLALVACVELSLASVWSGRLQAACHSVIAHGRAFSDCPGASAVDAATLVAAVAVLCPERQRGELLDKAQKMLDLEGVFESKLREGANKSNDAPEGAVAARAADAASRLRTSTDARSALADGKKQKLTFAKTPPPPRSGHALLFLSLGRCCQGDWVTARHAAGACVAITERGWGDARLGDLARCLGAVADAHLGRWEDALAAATSITHDRSSHAEIAPWCLAMRMAALTATRQPDAAVALWRKALRREPFRSLHLGADDPAYRRLGASGVGSRNGDLLDSARRSRGKDATPLSTVAEAGADMPALLAVRSFAAQALWCAGSTEEAATMIEQLCAQLKATSLTAHPLLPSAALAVGETVARASYTGLVSRRQGKEMMATCHSFLAQRASRLLPFSADLALKLRKVAPPGFI